MIISAQELTRTRLCRAHLCTQEADPYTRFCHHHHKQHQAGVEIRLQGAPPPQDHQTLRCFNCEAFKPHAAFSRCLQNTWRNQRHHECKQCAAERRNISRMAERLALGIVVCHATVQGYTSGRHGQPCRSWSQPGSPYCNRHQPKDAS